MLSRGGVSGKRPARRRSTEGYLSPRQGSRKGPRIHPQPPLPLQQLPAWSVERPGWSGGGGDPLQMSFSPDVPPSHTRVGERGKVSRMARRFASSNGRGSVVCWGAGQSRAEQGKERRGWLQRSRSRGKGTPIVGSPSASRAMIRRNPDRIL